VSWIIFRRPAVGRCGGSEAVLSIEGRIACSHDPSTALCERREPAVGMTRRIGGGAVELANRPVTPSRTQRTRLRRRSLQKQTQETQEPAFPARNRDANPADGWPLQTQEEADPSPARRTPFDSAQGKGDDHRGLCGRQDAGIKPRSLHSAPAECAGSPVGMTIR